MHFIFLTLGYHPDQVGGAFRYVAEVSERLARRQHRVEVVYPAAESTTATETRAGVSLRRYPNPRGVFWANWRRENAAARRLWREAARAVSDSPVTVSCQAYFAPAFQTCPRPRVFLFTGPWAEEHRLARQAGEGSWPRRWVDRLVVALMRREEGRALRHADRILTISRYYETQLPRWHGVGLPPVTVISGGVDADRFRPVADRAATRVRWGLGPDQFLFLAVRRLDPRMGLLALVESFHPVARVFPHAQLWIAGAGPQRDALARRITELDLGARVRLLGLVPETDLVSLLNAADGVVMPSLDLEGFGLTTAESLACGTAVLGSRAGANPELLAPLSESLLFEARSTSALTVRLEEVLRNPSTLPDRARCRDYAIRQFSWDKVASAVEAATDGLRRPGGGA